MAQRPGERARGPAEATGLYRAVLLRSGKWGHDHPGPAAGRPRAKQGGASILHGSAFLPSGPSFLPSFILFTFFPLCSSPFFSFLLPSFCLQIYCFIPICERVCTHTHTRTQFPHYRSPARFHLPASLRQRPEGAAARVGGSVSDGGGRTASGGRKAAADRRRAGDGLLVPSQA